jgi:hypothetical protein
MSKGQTGQTSANDDDALASELMIPWSRQRHLEYRIGKVWQVNARCADPSNANMSLDCMRRMFEYPRDFTAEQITSLAPCISIASAEFEAHSTSEGSLRLCYSISADRASRDSSSRRTDRFLDISRPDPP